MNTIFRTLVRFIQWLFQPKPKLSHELMRISRNNMSVENVSVVGQDEIAAAGERILIKHIPLMRAHLESQNRNENSKREGNGDGR